MRRKKETFLNGQNKEKEHSVRVRRNGGNTRRTQNGINVYVLRKQGHYAKNNNNNRREHFILS